MKKALWIPLVMISCANNGDRATDLWPEIEPYTSGYLRVSDLHEIYYELCGNPEGIPVFVLHGGPGGGCSPEMRRYFNPRGFNIVLHDQRGAGRSKPFAEIRENNTGELVADIEKLRRHLGVEKMLLFGGSWGATLTLAYAETHPDRVSGMVLRGVFTARRSEIDFYYHGGVRNHFPEVYDRFLAGLPEPDTSDLPQYLFNLLQSPDPAVRVRTSRLWAEYEIKLASLHFADEGMDAIFTDFDPYAFALLENYYMANGCFLQEGQLFRDADRIVDIPAILVNGRYDMICPPLTAYELHQRLPNSRLVIAESAGHWMGEKPVQAALLEAVREFEGMIAGE